MQRVKFKQLALLLGGPGVHLQVGVKVVDPPHLSKGVPLSALLPGAPVDHELGLEAVGHGAPFYLFGLGYNPPQKVVFLR